MLEFTVLPITEPTNPRCQNPYRRCPHRPTKQLIGTKQDFRVVYEICDCETCYEGAKDTAGWNYNLFQGRQ